MVNITFSSVEIHLDCGISSGVKDLTSVNFSDRHP